MTDPEVKSAGGIVFRIRAGQVEFLIIHRPRYDDWALPKGKLEAGETGEEAALREVKEETGLACQLLEELSSISYIDRHGRSKVVRYWCMRPLSEDFVPNEEADEARWLTGAEAEELLTYDHDKALLKEVPPHRAARSGG